MHVTERPVEELTLEELRVELADTRMQMEVNSTQVYCPKCGSCGIDGCCSASMCAYLDESKETYREMRADIEDLWNGVKLMRRVIARGNPEDHAALKGWEAATRYPIRDDLFKD